MAFTAHHPRDVELKAAVSVAAAAVQTVVNHRQCLPAAGPVL